VILSTLTRLSLRSTHSVKPPEEEPEIQINNPERQEEDPQDGVPGHLLYLIVLWFLSHCAVVSGSNKILAPMQNAGSVPALIRSYMWSVDTPVTLANLATVHGIGLFSMTSKMLILFLFC